MDCFFDIGYMVAEEEKNVNSPQFSFYYKAAA